PADDSKTDAEEELPAEETPPPQNSLLSSSDFPYEDERQPVTTKLQVNTDEPTGALTLSFPITVPPGRNGMEPSLSLGYSSQRQESVNVVGSGWTVDIPYIERSNRKGVETLYSDHYFRSSLDDELATTSIANSELYGAKVENGAFRKYEYKSAQYWQ